MPTAESTRAAFIPGDSEMARRMRDFDWPSTPLGGIEHWPQSLRSSVATCLDCAFPFVIWWGPELITLYNDEYQSVLGAKHPAALGDRCENVWSDVWDVIGPMLMRVKREGRPTRSRDLQLHMERHGYIEEAYFSFSYGPLYDEQGAVAGIFCPVIETTDKVIGERRLRTLRDLAARCQGAIGEPAVLDAAAAVLGDNRHDVPFAMMYLVDPGQMVARLANAVGIARETDASPATIRLDDVRDPWRLGAVSQWRRTQVVTDLRAHLRQLPGGAWPESSHTAIVLPVSLPGEERPRAILVAGVSPRRLLDQGYRTFFEFLATQIASGLADARAREGERRRAEALAEIDRAKTAFFSNVSHEFRTPLTLMLAPLEDSLADVREPLARAHQQRLRVAHRNGLRLLKLVNALLDFSRIEAGRIEASYAPLDLATLTAELASNFRAACERGGLGLEIDCPPIDPTGPDAPYVDREMWEKIVLNLISNAFKFTFVGKVVVALRTRPGFAELSVGDTGTGIPAEALPHLFERFYRVDGARGRTAEGSGIGLSLVRELVKLHGGTVRVSSVLGLGSTFTVTIPLGSAHLPPDRVEAGGAQVATATATVSYVQEALRWAGGPSAPVEGTSAAPDGDLCTLPAPHGASPDSRGTGPRILWADDNADMREYVQHLLAPSYDVIAVGDGASALHEALARPPDLVISDVMMPGMDGVELLRLLRQDQATCDIPVILVSARAGEESRLEGLQTGADDYLIKPFSARELLARVGARLELARVRRDAEQRVRRTLESISDAFQVLDAGWRITYMNPVARQCFAAHGHDPDALIGKHFWDDLFPEARDGEAARHMSRSMTERVPVAFESYWAAWDTWYFCRFDPLPDGGLANYFHDITEQRRAGDTLRENRERLAADLRTMTRLQALSARLVSADNTSSLLLEIVDAAIALTAADMGNIQLFDPDAGALRIVASRGFERPFLDFFDEVHDDGSACGAAMRRTARTVVEDVGSSPVFAGSRARDVVLAAGVRAVQSTPLLDRAGRLVGMLSTHYRVPTRPADRDLRALDLLARQAADLIARRRAEDALRASEERFRRYFDLGLIGMAITSPTKGCLEVNDRMCEIVGYERAELLRLNWADLTPPEDLAADLAQLERVLAGEIDGYELDKRLVRKDGGVVATTISANAVRGPDGAVEYFVALAQDITSRKRAEEALRASEERYRALVSQVKDYAIFSTDERGIVTTWNEGCHQVLGYPEHEFLGLDGIELFTPEDRAAGVPAQIREAAQAGSARNDRWMLARGGRRFYAMGAKSGLRDSDGRLIGFSTVIRDVTQTKLAQDELAHHGESLERLVTERTDQLEKTTERLRLSERMASLGTLSAGLGHDMGNLLLPMDVRLELLLKADLPGELREHVLGIQKSAQYLQRLSNGLRLLATNPSSARSSERTEVQAWWNDVGMMFKDVLPRGVRFEHAMPQGECWLAIGRAALTQAVFNLVQNAADTLREAESGTVRIGMDDRRSSSVIVRVSDDGPGMSPEVLRRCREPYFSTKPRAVATGMGLAFVQGLVTTAGGRMAITSRLGHGTTICLMLRRAGYRRRSRERRHRIAVVAMQDARVRSYIAGELRTLGFEVRRELAGEVIPSLAVVDAGALAGFARDPRLREARILLLGDAEPSSTAGLALDTLRMGPALDPDLLGRALRDAADQADALEGR